VYIVCLFPIMSTVQGIGHKRINGNMFSRMWKEAVMIYFKVLAFD